MNPMTRAFLSTLLLLTMLPAASVAGYCDNAAVRSVQRPGNFTLKYSLSERENPDATVVIFIPGGPGQTSMSMALSLPYEFAVVRTDPRGVGCNENNLLPAQSLNSEEQARDVLAIVRDLKPKKYILHGISYGTVVATMAAALAKEENVPAPAAVVLEGTMGRVYQPNEYMAGYLQRWQELKQQLPKEVLRSLSSTPLPFGYDSKTWAAWLSSALIYGVLPTGENFAEDMLKGVAPNASDAAKAPLQAQLRMTSVPPMPSKIRLYKEIICRELVPDIRDVKYDFDMIGGDLVDSGLRLCQGTSLDRPYDSAKYQIQVPVFYFSGDKDPATPKPQVQYHFHHQRGPRTWVSVAIGGHQALSTNLMDCSENIWLAIGKDSTNDFAKALQTCKASSHIHVQQR